MALVLNWCESLVIELQRKVRLLPLLMSAIQLEFKSHYISGIDPGAAGIWAVIINDVKAIMDNNRPSIKSSNETVDFIYVFVYFEFQLLFMNLSCVIGFKLPSFLYLSFRLNSSACSLFFCFVGDAQFSEAVGYPMVQQWRVRSNLYKVKLSSITLSTGQRRASACLSDLDFDINRTFTP